MALAVSSIQDQAAYALFGAAYASLTTVQKALIDTPAANILRQIEDFAELVTMAAATGNAPDEWKQWFAARVVEEVGLSVHPDRVSDYRKARQIAERNAQDWYSRLAINYSFDTSTEAFVTTYFGIRKHVLSVSAKSRHPFFPNTESIDSATKWALNWIWGKAGWVYRRRQAELSMNTSSVVTVSSGLEAGETIDAIESFDLFISQAGYENQRIRWVSADGMAALKTRDGSTTGTPRYFRIRSVGDTWTWIFSPAPDITYTFRCEVLVSQPANPTGASGYTDTTPFSKFASEHMPTIKDLVLAKVRRDHQQEGAAEELRQAMCAVDELFPNQQSIGRPEQNPAVRDVYRDDCAVISDSMFGGGI